MLKKEDIDAKLSQECSRKKPKNRLTQKENVLEMKDLSDTFIAKNARDRSRSSQMKFCVLMTSSLEFGCFRAFFLPCNVSNPGKCYQWHLKLKQRTRTSFFFCWVFLFYFIYLFIYFLKLEEICLNNIKLLDGQIKH